MSAASEKEFYVSNIKLLQEYITWYTAIDAAVLANKPEPQIPPFICDAMMRIANRLTYNACFINYTFKEDMISDGLYDCIRFAKKFNPYKMLYKVIFECVSGTLAKKDTVIGETSGFTGTVKFYNSKTLGSSLQMNEEKDFFLGEIVVSDSGARFKVVEILSHLADNPFSFLTTICFNAFLRRIDKEKTQKYVKAMIVNNTDTSEFFDNQAHEEDGKYANQYIEFLKEVGSSEDSVPMSIKRTKKYQAALIEVLGPLDEFANE